MFNGRRLLNTKVSQQAVHFALEVGLIGRRHFEYAINIHGNDFDRAPEDGNKTQEGKRKTKPAGQIMTGNFQSLIGFGQQVDQIPEYQGDHKGQNHFLAGNQQIKSQHDHQGNDTQIHDFHAFIFQWNKTPLLPKQKLATKGVPSKEIV